MNGAEPILKDKLMDIDAFLNLDSAAIDEHIKDENTISLKTGETSQQFEILRTEAQLIDFLKGGMKHESALMALSEKQGGVAMVPYSRSAIVTFPIKNAPEIENHLYKASNLIFLKSVFLNQFENKQYLDLASCHFKEFVALGKNGIRTEQQLHFSKCTFKHILALSGIIDFVSISHTKISGVQHGLSFNAKQCKKLQALNSDIYLCAQNCSISHIELSGCKLYRVYFSNVSTEHKLNISSCSLDSQSSLSFANFFLSGYGKISFKELEGKLSFSDSVFQNLDFDFPSLKGSNYKPMTVIQGGEENYICTAENFSALRKIAKQNDENEAVLTCEFKEKQLQLRAYLKRLNQNPLKNLLRYPVWFGRKLYELLIGHFCYWRRILFSIVSVILVFALVYAFNSENILMGGKPINCGSDSWIDIALNSLYFSIITFTTIGYGDISPDSDSNLKFVAGIEGLIGVTLIAFLTATILRRYSK